jgi:hypothetical protein
MGGAVIPVFPRRRSLHHARLMHVSPYLYRRDEAGAGEVIQAVLRSIEYFSVAYEYKCTIHLIPPSRYPGPETPHISIV